MTATNRTITSREYKLMLNPVLFRDRAAGAVEIWSLVELLAVELGGTIVEVQDEEESRTTWYLDTPESALRSSGCCLRLRDEGKTKVTLKFRDVDRYIAAARDVSTAEAGEEKFEEDVLPRYSKFARSASIKLGREPSLNRVAAAIKLFPGLSGLQLAGASPLQPVSGLRMHEIMRKIGKLRFGAGPSVKACLSFWYPSPKAPVTPVAAEFSFDYDLPTAESDASNGLEQFPLATVLGARRLFQAVQRQGAWIDLTGTTKTDLAYGEA